METIRLTTAQALLKFLNNQYIVDVDGKEIKFFEGIVGIFESGNIVGIEEELEKSKENINYMKEKNQQYAVNKCIEFAKESKGRKTYPCISSIGQGALNIVAAAQTASANHIPLLLIPSDINKDHQTDLVLKQLDDTGDYTASTNDVFEPVSKYWDRVSKPEHLIRAGLNAMLVLTDPAKTGAVTICLPQEIQCQSYDYPCTLIEKRVWHVDGIQKYRWLSIEQLQ